MGKGRSAMKKPPASAAQPTGRVTVLAVDPYEEDYASLADIFSSCPWNLCPDASWILKISASLQSAWGALRNSRIPIVLCEYDLRPGTWRELLRQTATLPEPPFLIVTSRLADERLWAEALNLGAYDVLAKPFDRTEVVRVVSMAWLHWRDRYTACVPGSRVLAVASGQ